MKNNKPSASDITYVPLAPEHFEGVLLLGNRIQGDGYLSHFSLEEMYHKGCFFYLIGQDRGVA